MKRRMTVTLERVTLPEEIKAFTRMTGPEEYSVFISDQLTELEAARAWLHEMLHLWHDDFSRAEDLDRIEAERHKEEIELCKIRQCGTEAGNGTEAGQELAL